MFVGDTFMSSCVVPLSPSTCEGPHGTLGRGAARDAAWSQAGDVLELRARTSSDVTLPGLCLCPFWNNRVSSFPLGGYPCECR